MNVGGGGARHQTGQAFLRALQKPTGKCGARRCGFPMPVLIAPARPVPRESCRHEVSQVPRPLPPILKSTALNSSPTLGVDSFAIAGLAMRTLRFNQDGLGYFSAKYDGRTSGTTSTKPLIDNEKKNNKTNKSDDENNASILKETSISSVNKSSDLRVRLQLTV